MPTKREATELVQQKLALHDPRNAEKYVEMFEQLGMLKLDVDPVTRFWQRYHNDWKTLDAYNLTMRLNEMGLKIVEK